MIRPLLCMRRQLWTPWPLPLPDGSLLPAHTRFETTLRPGDVLYKPPAYFHSTLIIEGASVAVTHFYDDVPFGSSLRSHPWRNNPFGFDNCATDPAGWESYLGDGNRVEL